VTQDSDPFQVNPAASVHVEYIGPQCPVMVIDDVFSAPDAVRSLALGGAFDSSLAYYPGLHSGIHKDRLQGLFGVLARLLGAVGHAQVRADAFFSDFSVVTTPAADMLARQKHPHIDGLPLAGVIYLSPQLEVGTSFFRHLPSGLSMLRDADEIAHYNQWLEAFGDVHQPASYAVEQDGIWQRLHSVTGRYNRLVMYPGNAFHSIDMRDVPSRQTLSAARLTQRLFLRTLD
jgi:hypothetical protein